MRELRIEKRANLERLLKEKSKDKLFQSFGKIISANLPVSLWDSLTADDIFHLIKDYVSFIIDSPPFKKDKGKILYSPKVRVYNPEVSETYAASFKEDTTIVEIHSVNKLFIYESVRNYFTKSGYRIIGAVHPTFFAERKTGKIKSVTSEGEGEGELFVNLYIEREPDTKKLDEIKSDIHAILRCIELSVDDYKVMKEELQKIILDLKMKEMLVMGLFLILVVEIMVGELMSLMEIILRLLIQIT